MTRSDAMRLAEAVRDECHDQCGCHENFDVHAFTDRWLAEQQPDTGADRCTCPSSAVSCVRHGPSRDFIWRDHLKGYEAAAHARGVAEERERCLRLVQKHNAAWILTMRCIRAAQEGESDG